jgi:hypothetical protein
MKKIIVLLVILALGFAWITPASASGNGPVANGNGNESGAGPVTKTGQAQQGPRGTFAITGAIVAIGTNTVTIDVLRGNKVVQPYLGTQLTLTLTSKTRYVLRDGTSTTKITFADLKVGQSVSANGKVANNIWTTSRITVGASLSCLP